MTESFFFDVESPASLNEFLRARLHERFGEAASNSKIRRLLFSGNVFVCPKARQKDSRVKRGNDCEQAQDARGGAFFACKNPMFALKKNARVKVLVDQEKFFYEKPTDDIKFELDETRVLYEDDAIIVVNKPPRFPTEPTFVQDRDNLRAAVIRRLHKKIGLDKNPPYCGLVHRLDRDTSGAILLSKKRSVNAALFAAFDSSETAKDCRAKDCRVEPDNDRERRAKKTYIAVCGKDSNLGRAKDFRAGMEFSVQNYLGRVSPKSEAAKWGEVPSEKGGKFARTDFKILQEKGGLFLVEAKLFTGRTHQIRVHLSQSGLPILGDVLYGGRAAERIFLHALRLELPHPESGETMRFEAPLPPEFSARL